MSTRSFQKHHQRQKKQDNSDRRNQAKRNIDKALDARAVDFAEDARKINELYGKYAAVNDADGFANAVLEYANIRTNLATYTSQLSNIINGYKQQGNDKTSTPLTPEQLKSSTPTKVAADAYDYEQRRLENMHKEFQRLLRRIS